MKFKPVFILFLLVILLVSLFAGASAGNSLPSKNFLTFYPINESNDRDDLTSAAAYASKSGEFLVVWNYEFADGEFDIRGRFVDPSGNPLGNEFTIVETGFPEFDPDLAYDAKTGVFLVVWTLFDPDMDTSRIQGRIVAGGHNNSGNYLIGDILDITDGTVNAGAPAVVHNEDDEQYLVVYTYNGEDIAGRRIWNSYGTPFPVADQFFVHNFPASTQVGEPDAAWSPDGDTFLVVWPWTDVGATEMRLVGRMVYDAHQADPDGQRQGAKSWILDSSAYSPGTMGSDAPSVAYDPENGEYVVSYETNGPSGGLSDWGIYYFRTFPKDPNDDTGFSSSDNIQVDIGQGPNVAYVWGTDLMRIDYRSIPTTGRMDLKSYVFSNTADSLYYHPFDPDNEWIRDVANANVVDGETGRSLVVFSLQSQSWNIGNDFEIWGVEAVDVCYPLNITLDPAAGGKVSANEPPGCQSESQYINYTSVRLTAKPNSGYEFSHWSGDLTGKKATSDWLNMDSEKTIVAHFKKTAGEPPPPTDSFDVYLPAVLQR